MTKQLSSTAQAVLDAMYEVNMDFGYENAALAAAALEAVADQVVPEGKVYTETVPDAGVFVSTEPPARFRSKILAIAAELRAQT